MVTLDKHLSGKHDQQDHGNWSDHSFTTEHLTRHPTDSGYTFNWDKSTSSDTHRLRVTKGPVVLARALFSTKDDELVVEDLQVATPFRRHGLGTTVLTHIQRQYPSRKLTFGDSFSGTGPAIAISNSWNRRQAGRDLVERLLAKGKWAPGPNAQWKETGEVGGGAKGGSKVSSTPTKAPTSPTNTPTSPTKSPQEGTGSEPPSPPAASAAGGVPSSSPFHMEHTPATHSHLSAIPGSNLPPEDPWVVQNAIADAEARGGERMRLISRVAGTDQMSVAGERRGQDTMGMYGKWEGNRFLGWTFERAQWQADTLNQMEQDQIRANDNRQPKSDKQAIIMAGLPGSGKTFLLNNQLASQFDIRDYVTINADDVKLRIIENGDPPQIEDLEGEELSSMVHEESSDMAKAWEKSVVGRGLNIALDITASDQTKGLARIKALEDAGYTVHLVHSDITPVEALASTAQRAVNGGRTPGHIGRPVPPEFIKSMATNGHDIIDDAFPAYEAAVNGNTFWYRNYPLSRQEPVLVASSTPETRLSRAQQPQAPAA